MAFWCQTKAGENLLPDGLYCWFYPVDIIQKAIVEIRFFFQKEILSYVPTNFETIPLGLLVHIVLFRGQFKLNYT